MKRFSILASLLLLTMVCRAQEPAATPPRPDPPYLNRAPAYAAWVIHFKTTGTPENLRGAAPAQGRGTAAPAPPPVPPSKIQQISVVKAGDIILEEQMDAAGRKTDRWIVGGLQAVQAPGAPLVVLAGRGGDDSWNCSYTKGDFCGFDWLSADSYTETKQVGDAKCFVFRGAVSSLTRNEAASMEDTYEGIKFLWNRDHNAAAEAASGIHMQDPNAPGLRAADHHSATMACIDSATRLPVLLQVGSEIRTYQFNPTPPAPLTLPPEVQRAINQQQRRARAAASLPAPP